MEDLIRRQDAANLLYKMLADDYVDGYAYLEQLRALPSAEPERKKGKWVEKKYIDNADYPIPEWQSAKCSVCGKYMTSPYMYNFTDYQFCPSCGAEMSGGDNETDR